MRLDLACTKQATHIIFQEFDLQSLVDFQGPRLVVVVDLFYSQFDGRIDHVVRNYDIRAVDSNVERPSVRYYSRGRWCVVMTGKSLSAVKNVPLAISVVNVN